MRLDLLEARGSTSQIDAGSFPAAAVDSAELLRRFRETAMLQDEARPWRRCSFQKARLADRLHAALIRQTCRALLARFAIAALVLCCRRIRDNSFPRFQLHDHPISALPLPPSDPRDPRCRKNAE